MSEELRLLIGGFCLGVAVSASVFLFCMLFVFKKLVKARWREQVDRWFE